MANLKYKDNNGNWQILNTVRGPKGDNADITLNGQTHINASFYAPEQSGTIGQFLTSYGSGNSPVWVNLSRVAATGNYDDLNGKPIIPTTTNDIISGSTAALTSGGAFTALAQRGIPSGGSAGQVLIKSSGTDYAVEWGNTAGSNAISGDGSIKKIVELTYAEYKALEEIDPDTEYHISDLESGASTYINEAQIQDMIDDSIPPIINNLTSTSTTSTLSAAQGKVLNDAISGIISNGSNENGNWIKYSDGTMMQYGEATFGTSGTNVDSYIMVTFPQSFVGSYRIFAQIRYTGGISQNYTLGTILTPSVDTSKTYNYIYRRLSYYAPGDAEQTQLYSQALPFYWFAIGRWK